jgi:proteasome lid subunit RPN8/RPN11
VKLTQSHLDGISAHGKRGYPYEVCGVFLGKWGTGRVDKVVEMENRETEQPKIRYQIAPEDLLKLQRDAGREGLEIIGFYHTHPDHPPRPSETDRRVAAGGLSDGVYHMVMAVEKGERTHLDTVWIFRESLQAFEPEPLEIELS